MFEFSPLFGVVGLVVLIVVVGLGVASRYKVGKPNEAFVVTGRKGKSGDELSGQKVVIGAGVFAVPFVQQVSVIDLSSMRIPVKVTGATSKNGIMLNVDGIAQVKVGGNEAAIRAASQRFGRQQGSIADFTIDTLSAALRGVVGTLTVEEIISDRASFAASVSEATEATLTGQGLVVDNFLILEVQDADGTYLKNLARPEAARVKQEAVVAEADAERTAEQRRLAAQTDIINAKRDFELNQARIKAETDAAAATAAAAGPLAEAAKEQEVLAAQELVAIRQAELTDKELDTRVRKPADAARYAAEQEALADKATKVAQAQAEAERERLTGEAERDRRAAIAEATRLEGEAQAAATLAVGSAEAEAMEKRAAAMNSLDTAGVRQLLIEKMPEMARELASPMAAIKDLTVIHTEGASALPKAVANNGEQVFSMVKSLTGIDLKAMLNGGDVTDVKADQNGSSISS